MNSLGALTKLTSEPEDDERDEREPDQVGDARAAKLRENAAHRPGD